MNKHLYLFVKSILYYSKEYLLFIIFLLAFQSLKADEDLQIIEKNLIYQIDDTAKINSLLKLGEHYCSIENEKALLFLQEAFTISTSQNYTKGIGKSLLWQGRVYYYNDNYPLSLKYLTKAEKFIKLTNELDDLAFLYFAKGEICNIRGDYIHALEMYKAAIELTEKTKNLKLTSSFYNSIGTILLKRNDAKKALEYFKETLSIKKQINDQKGIANALTSIGKSYENLGILDSSLIYYNQALEIRRNHKMNRSIAGSEYNIGRVFIKMGMYAKAEESFEIAFKNFNKLKEKTGVIITNLQWAVAQSKQGKKEAVERANKALEMAKNIDNPNLISQAYKILSDIYSFNNNHQNAYRYLSKHKTLQDSLFTAEKERLLTEFETKYQLERKDNKIELLNSQANVQKKNNILLVVFIVVLFGVIVLLIFLFRFKSTAYSRQQKVMEQEIIISTQENEIVEKENLIMIEQLESKNRELASKALEMLRFNDTISIIIEKLDNLNITMDHNPEIKKHTKDIILELENHTKQNIWKEFDKIFKNIHSGFYDKLLELCPDLSPTEIKIAALLKLNLTTKEIAAITYKSEGGIKTTRYRLRKKIKLTSDEKLVPFLMKI